MFEEYFSWNNLGNFAVMVGVVTLIIQYTKMPLDKVLKIPTRIAVWLLSFVLLLIVKLATVELTLEVVSLALFNSLLVASSSMGVYDVTFKKLEK